MDQDAVVPVLDLLILPGDLKRYEVFPVTQEEIAFRQFQACDSYGRVLRTEAERHVQAQADLVIGEVSVHQRSKGIGRFRYARSTKWAAVVRERAVPGER